jgi:uncharacterized protein (DUF3820 family)
MTEQQKRLVEPILSTIKNDDIREFAEVLLDGLPDYMWHVGASSTGKYHPAYSLGEGGLMRHQIAVVRFLNFFFELEQYNTKFNDREMDLMRVAGLVHDGRKSGEQADYERSKFTKFDHPIQMANVIRSFDGKHLNHDELEFMATCIESHMGQWSTDRKSSIVLPKPMNVYQEFIHLADYLASRKDLTMAFDVPEQPKTETVNLDCNTYVLNFGKYSGTKLVDLYKKDKGYCMWLKENSYKKEVVEMIKQIEAKQTVEGDDEI